MTELLLIRHGETAWNASRRLQGHLDIPLNEEGKRQAAALGCALRSQVLDAIYSSDLQRALDTAREIAEPRGMALRIDPGLRERCYGGFEGLLYSEIGVRFPDAFSAWQVRAMDAPLPAGVHAGETLRRFFDRVVLSLKRIATRHPGRRVAVVAHGGVLECAYRAAQGVAPDRPRDFSIFNASINRFAWDGEALALLEWGNVDHLRNEPVAALDEIVR